MPENKSYPNALPTKELKPNCGPVFRNYDETPPNEGRPDKEIAKMSFQIAYADILGPPKNP